MFQKVDLKQKVNKREEKIARQWEKKKAFQKSLQLTKKKPVYTFYDGPPFATGTPHYGHIVASVMKDVVPRYWTMRGRYVERRWGWDCHGLPIENIVEKEMGSQQKKDIEKMGVEKFNRLCRSKVLSYVEDWKKVIRRLGRWVDMENAYKTMDLDYMESVWWVFKNLYDQGLIYKDYRSMHICPRCETTLSQSEVAEGYKDVKDLSVTAKFELKEGQKIKGKSINKNTFILAWTTTPWTLPGNVALAVGKDIDYVMIERQEENKIKAAYILAKSRLEEILKEKGYKIIKQFKGKDLIGLKYKPLWDVYAKDKNLKNRERGWKIYSADFVTTEEGTGVVHIAPAFGEDDMNLGKKEKLPFVQHVGMDGLIEKKVKGLGGLHVKPLDNPQATDVEVIKYLARKNLLLDKTKYEHSYPHCWRCDSPLINYATSSWFVRVTEVKKEALRLAQKINWSPEHIKEGRFGKWLEGARDWSISRQRFWASVMPIWECDHCQKREVLGSVKELENKYNRTLYVMRHGEAKSNVKKILTRDKEGKFPLTAKGKKQVEEVAEKLKEKKVDLIISSDILRTRETAEIIAKKLGAKLVFDRRIREVNGGTCDGQKIENCQEVYQEWIEGKKVNWPQGESHQDILDRVKSFYSDLIRKYASQNILVITHGDIIVTLEAYLSKQKNLNSVIKKIYQESYIRPAEWRQYQMKIFDIHKDVADKITWQCSCGGKMQRVPDVLDTWFDSGSMPYAQLHYPFQNKSKFKKGFPADFIAEGQDQTRAWFYYLHVIATALQHNIAFKNVIVNGIVLAEDGKKMSKKLKNYPDPMEMFEKYGADTVRFYLMSSPVVAAQNISFSEQEVSEIARGMMRMLFNSYSFLVMYANIDHWKPTAQRKKITRKNLLDRWIISELQLLIAEFNKQMERYRLHKAARLLPAFIDNLSNWYIRRSRRRFWKSENDADKNEAYATLYYVLVELSKVIAPLMPFIAEEIYSNLVNSFQKKWQSVHWQKFPQAQKKWIDEKLNLKMAKTREIIKEALQLRAQAQIKVRQPLAKLLIKDNLSEKLNQELLAIIQEEVNVKEIKMVSRKTVSPKIVWDKNYQVGLDIAITENLELEGQAREIVRFIQQMRKKADYNLDDRIQLSYQGMEKVFQKFSDLIAKEVLAQKIFSEPLTKFDLEQAKTIDGENLVVKIKR